MVGKNKVWKKNIKTIRNIGLCKYCSKMIVSDEPFVVFATKEPAHYFCMKKDEKEKELEIDS